MEVNFGHLFSSFIRAIGLVTCRSWVTCTEPSNEKQIHDERRDGVQMEALNVCRKM